ncbi:hypothetical protein FALCPG4_015312 [Fusarium falciforme]
MQTLKESHAFASLPCSSLPAHLPCLTPQKEFSHILAHAVTHHGLIRSSRHRKDRRKYITACRSDHQLTKGRADWQKCRQIHKWKDKDFEAYGHGGDAVCLRCWCRFTKKALRDHLNGPSYPYRAEQPKSEKMMILYTTFCSDSKPPTVSKPPTLPPRQQSSGRSKKQGHAPPPSFSAATSPATTETPATLTEQEDPEWPYSLYKMEIPFVLGFDEEQIEIQEIS